MNRLTFQVGALLLLGFWTGQGWSAPRPYKLAESSRFQTGCFTLCNCPILDNPLRGTFGLELVAYGPLFDEYRMVDVRWSIPGSAAEVSITGSGTYRIGGEVAVQHQMVLDLSVDGGAVRRFDSGLLGTTNAFPAIDIRIPLHGDSACLDTVLVIRAAPLAATGVESPVPEDAIQLFVANSNPFRDRADFVIHVRKTGNVTIEVIDVHGRIVHRWTRSDLTPGDHLLTWDGRTSSGEEASTGRYLVRARQRWVTAVVRVTRLR